MTADSQVSSPFSEMTNPLTELLRRSVKEWPDQPAILDVERSVAITYRQLEARSNDLRDLLLKHGVRPGDRVGICAPKSVGTLVAIFGILSARAVYVPVDASAPPQRNAGIFDDCTIALAVVDASLVASLRDSCNGRGLEVAELLGDELVVIRWAEILQENGTGGSAELADKLADELADELAYILYTSGSTGKPKGVVHTHRSALSFIDWCSDTFTPNESDRFSSHAPFHFDLSILDIYVPLKHGATLVLIGEEVGKQPVRLASLIAEARITVWYSTPSILRLLAEYGRLEKFDFSSLRLVLFAGEVFPVRHFFSLRKFWRSPSYFNLYGPTETNVCTYYEVPSDISEDRAEPFPIGFACSGDRGIVVDDNNRETALGKEGELLINGGSVMRNYWNLPERTARAFFNDDQGLAWYRTGDIVRESPDNGYIFVGRRDRMVKRRGYRVELGEIEAAMYRYPLVAEAAAIAFPDEENGVSIRVFLSLSGGERPSLVALKRFCSGHLPAYMIPDGFSFAESLPKTSTDKIDYEQLRSSI